MSKNAVFISCFHYYDNRIRIIEDHLRRNGYNCTYITSNYDHIEKEKFLLKGENKIQIPTKPYQRNLSIQRIRSHIRFAQDVFLKTEALMPDFIFVMTPPNSLAKQAAKYKKKHPNTLLVLDLYDLWPESFPQNGIKKLMALPFLFWRNLRNSGIFAADMITMECELYRNYLPKQLSKDKAKVLYLCKQDVTIDEALKIPDSKELELCFLGSINNIIDIPTIAKLIEETVQIRPVILHIIGDGESCQELIQTVTKVGAKVEYHGKIYNDSQKQAIFNRCSFGINMSKKNLCIGLTMKSIDYFAGGLPILNTIAGDTHVLIEKHNVGINVDLKDIRQTAERIAHITPDENLQMRQNALSMFKDLFSERSFSEHVKNIFTLH